MLTERMGSYLVWAVAGIVGLLAWRGAKAAPALPASPFEMVNGVRYWRPSLAGDLATALGRFDAGPHLSQDGTPSGVERLYSLYPKDKGMKPALIAIKELQAQPGNVVTSTTNLLDTSATAGPKGIGVLLPAEFPAKVTNAEGVAVLPKLG